MAREVKATKVAELYLKHWTIEGRFYEVTQTLDCEPNTLAYPKAALFAFCLALVASNAVASTVTAPNRLGYAVALANPSDWKQEGMSLTVDGKKRARNSTAAWQDWAVPPFHGTRSSVASAAGMPWRDELRRAVFGIGFLLAERGTKQAIDGRFEA